MEYGNLLLTRKIGDSICISGDIKISVVSIKGDQVKLMIHAPLEVSVNREEIDAKIKGENHPKLQRAEDRWLKTKSFLTHALLVSDVGDKLLESLLLCAYNCKNRKFSKVDLQLVTDFLDKQDKNTKLSDDCFNYFKKMEYIFQRGLSRLEQKDIIEQETDAQEHELIEEDAQHLLKMEGKDEVTE